MENPIESDFTPTPIPLGMYLPCPECGVYFRSANGFSGHLVEDHWWDRAVADKRWIPERAVAAPDGF